jgi:hypothetical protein
MWPPAPADASTRVRGPAGRRDGGVNGGRCGGHDSARAVSGRETMLSGRRKRGDRGAGPWARSARRPINWGMPDDLALGVADAGDVPAVHTVGRHPRGGTSVCALRLPRRHGPGGPPLDKSSTKVDTNHP